ncbi:MAG: DegT/DnrJ/EryC1/StrS family aminotransferase [Lentisphaeria bacterium]
MTTPQDQKRLFLSPPHLSGAELELVKDAFASNYIAPLGPMVNAFEEEFSNYTQIPHCVAVSSGTAAMHLALRHILKSSEFGVQGSESGGVMATTGGGRSLSGRKPVVLASTLTFIGSVSPIVYENAEPVFIDCDPETWNMDPVLLEQTLEEYADRGIKPAAVIPTDLYGQCCDLPRLQKIGDRFGVPVICDSAEAMGAFYSPPDSTDTVASRASEWCHAGLGADASVYSFNGNKMITSSGGGMLASHDKELIDHARKLATQARDPAPHYQHSEIGFNYRMSNIVAAIGCGQLRVVDERVAQARQVFEGYRQRLGDIPGISFMPEPAYSRSNHWLTVITLDSEQSGLDPLNLRLALEAENIEARPIWKPMHMQPVFEKARVIGGEVSEHFFKTGLCLPSGTALTDNDLDRVCDIIRQTGNNAGE